MNRSDEQVSKQMKSQADKASSNDSAESNRMESIPSIGQPQIESERAPLASETNPSQIPRPLGTVLAPLPGFVWNPLRKLPPNSLCPCRSRKKFKKCCLPKLPAAVPAALADQYRRQIAQGNLTFMTEDNVDDLKKEMPERLWLAKQHELELQRMAATAPPMIFIKEAWLCDCGCMNEGALMECHECKIDKPVGKKLERAMIDARTKQELAMNEHRAKIAAGNEDVAGLPVPAERGIH
jgi:hypothetical protein